MRMTLNGIAVLCLFLTTSGILQSQTNLNMVLQDSMDYATGVNDVCGWVDASGNEYALVGLNTGVSIVNVDTTPIVEVAFVPGVNNIWRDINTFGHYAYVSSEARVGLLIIDLQYLPDSVKTYVWNDTLPTANGGAPFEKAHTLWIDEFGICYLNGSNLNAGGCVLIDVASNPTDPVFLGYAPAVYSHDCYTRDSIIYSAEIFSGTISIYDAHDPQNITLISRTHTPNEFTHNAWLSDNSRYMFTTDERANSYVTAYDIQDPANPVEIDRFRQAATDGSGNIPHNVYVWNDWLVVAYYTSGTLIVDAARPDNLIEVGSFDSFLGADGDYNGVWGSYPFLPSGKILSSDRQSGLFVFVPNYVRAAYLEGIVIDSITQSPIQGAVVTILSDEIILPQITDLEGSFKTGKAVPGTYPVTVEKGGYYPKTILLEFINGEVLTPLIELRPLPEYVLSGTVIDMTGNNVPNAQVALSGSNGEYSTITDVDGNFIIPSVFGGQYHVQAGIWGHTVETDIDMTGSQNVTLQLIQGYYDDFDLDLGWTVSGNATEGEWMRGIPTSQTLFGIFECGSGTDSPFDQGSFTYSTGLSSSTDVSTDEVEGGTTLLASPPMDLDSISKAQISFDYWICEFQPNLYVGASVWLTNQEDTLLLTELSNDTIVGSWQSFFTEVDISSFAGPKNNFQILFSATDTTSVADEYYLKVHIDRFKLEDATLSTGDENNGLANLLFYPNPVSGNVLYINSTHQLKGDHITLNFFDTWGRKQYEETRLLDDAIKGFSLPMDAGIFYVRWQTEKGESGVEKILIMTK